jgi:hypothetical protein
MTRAPVAALLWRGLLAARSAAGPRGVARAVRRTGTPNAAHGSGQRARGKAAVGGGGVERSDGLGTDRTPGAQ